MNRLILTSVLLTVLTISSCGGGAGGTTPSTVGGSLNDAFDLESISCSGTVTGGTFSNGDFSITVANGAMSSCVNATTPESLPLDSLPANMDIENSEANVTSGALAYSFSLGSDARNFNTDQEGSISLQIPFDPTAIPLIDRDSTHVYVRLKNTADGSLVDLVGTLDLTNNIITVDLLGLPANLTAIVVYDPNMAETASTTTASTSASISKSLSTTWGAAKYCVVYSTSNADIQTALATYQTSHPGATADDMMQNQIAKWAVRAQNEYVDAGFRQAALITFSSASDPCGGTLGTTARFNINIRKSGSEFSVSNGDGIVDVSGNHYGRIFIAAEAINRTNDDTYGGIYATIAHEMLHSIHYAYGFDTWTHSILGYDEGSATTYGRTLSVNADLVSREPKVRLASNEVFKLSNFIGQNSATIDASGRTTGIDVVAYSNQDFFAYVGRKYWSDNLSYLSGLFSQISSDVASAAASGAAFQFQPARSLILDSMSTFFQGNFSGQPTLKQVYLDFIAQRAMEHNVDSQLRGSETSTAYDLNSDLFDTVAISENSIDPANIGSTSSGFGAVAPFAARVIKITPSAPLPAGTAGATVTLTLSSPSGAVGDRIDGYSYQNGTRGNLAATNTFSNFGTAASDEIIILVANTKIDDTRADINFTISGESAATSPLPSSTTSTFTVDEFSLPGEGSWSPAYVVVTPDSGLVFVGMIGSTTNLVELATLKNLQVQFNSAAVTGTGTYVITGNDSTTGPAAILYSPGTIAAQANSGEVFTSTGGTITVTAFEGSSTSGRIAGSFSATMSNDNSSAPKSGTIQATFDFIVPSANNL